MTKQNLSLTKTNRQMKEKIIANLEAKNSLLVKDGDLSDITKTVVRESLDRKRFYTFLELRRTTLHFITELLEAAEQVYVLKTKADGTYNVKTTKEAFETLKTLI